MANVHTLSATRVVSYCSPDGNIVQPFTGSSLLRKKTVKKTPEISKAEKGESCKNDAIAPMEDSTDILRDGKALQRPDKRSGNTERCMSARTRRKLKDKAFALIYSSGKHDFYFLTLTFINRVEDTKAVKVLNKFLTALRDEYGSFGYIWVAERQNKNKVHAGNIHFHIIADLRIDIVKFNALWVLQQYNSGIEHEKYGIETVKEHYKKGTVKSILNPLDVRHAKNIDKVAAYLTTYITKNKDVFSCQPWNCSKIVSKLFTSMVVQRGVVQDAQDISINSKVDTETGEVLYEPKTYVSEYAVITYIINKEHFRLELSDMNRLNAFLISGKPEDKPQNLPQFFMDKICLN